MFDYYRFVVGLLLRKICNLSIRYGILVLDTNLHRCDKNRLERQFLRVSLKLKVSL